MFFISLFGFANLFAEIRIFIRIFNDCEVRIENCLEGKCLVSRGLPSDAKKLSRVMEFSIHSKQPLWILFPAYASFDKCIQA